jgi:hypothetical protein
MNSSFNSTPSLIAECKDTSEKIDLYEKYVKINIYYKLSSFSLY